MKKFFVIAACCLAAFACWGCGSRQPRRIQRVNTAMGTVIQQNIYTLEADSPAAEEIEGLLRQLEEKELSRRLDTSEVWAVNQAAGAEEGILLSPELAKILEDCLKLWSRSQGAFDVTIGTVVSLWDIDGWAAGEKEGAFAPPGEEELRRALENCGSGRLELAGDRLFMPEGVQLDLGAVGKGIALNRILRYLEGEEGVTGAVISLGGSVLTYGEKPDGSSWKVGIANPADTTSNIGVLSLEGQWCVSTSGDYERYVEWEGVRYHHILNPATGCPADSGVSGVTVLSRDGFLSDALSTACFVLGTEKGMSLAEEYGAEVLFVGKDGSVTMSRGMEEYYRAAE